jgi:hypothetical protein
MLQIPVSLAPAVVFKLFINSSSFYHLLPPRSEVLGSTHHDRHDCVASSLHYRVGGRRFANKRVREIGSKKERNTLLLLPSHNAAVRTALLISTTEQDSRHPPVTWSALNKGGPRGRGPINLVKCSIKLAEEVAFKK